MNGGHGRTLYGHRSSVRNVTSSQHVDKGRVQRKSSRPCVQIALKNIIIQMSNIHDHDSSISIVFMPNFYFHLTWLSLRVDLFSEHLFYARFCDRGVGRKNNTGAANEVVEFAWDKKWMKKKKWIHLTWCQSISMLITFKPPFVHWQLWVRWNRKWREKNLYRSAVCLCAVEAFTHFVIYMLF